MNKNIFIIENRFPESISANKRSINNYAHSGKFQDCPACHSSKVTPVEHLETDAESEVVNSNLESEIDIKHEVIDCLSDIDVKPEIITYKPILKLNAPPVFVTPTWSENLSYRIQEVKRRKAEIEEKERKKRKQRRKEERERLIKLEKENAKLKERLDRRNKKLRMLYQKLRRTNAKLSKLVEHIKEQKPLKGIQRVQIPTWLTSESYMSDYDDEEEESTENSKMKTKNVDILEQHMNEQDLYIRRANNEENQRISSEDLPELINESIHIKEEITD